MLPSLAAARSQAKTVKCSTNIRSIGQAAAEYAHDHDGYIPRDYYPNQHRTTNVHDGKPHVLLPEVLAPFLQGPPFPLIPYSRDTDNASRDELLAPIFAKMKLLQCPAFPESDQPPVTIGGTVIDESPYDYVVNAFWFEYERTHGEGQYRSEGITRLERIPQPQRLIYVTEADRGAAFNRFGWHDVFHGDVHLWWGSDPRMIYDNRHRGSLTGQYGFANALFFDGHNETMRIEKMTIRYFSPYSNPALHHP